MTNAPHRIPLNPCDYLFYAHHRAMQRKFRAGGVVFMALDVEGHIAPGVVRTALREALAAHPAAAGPLRFSLLRGQPYWRAVRQSAEIDRAAARGHVYYDLRNDPCAAGTLNRLMHEQFSPHWSFAQGPQIRLEQYALADRKTLFCIRWPHCFTDAEGAQLFLSEINRIGGRSATRADDAVGANASPAADYAALDPLADVGLFDRLRLIRGAPKRPRSGVTTSTALLAASLNQPVRRDRFLHQQWSADDCATVAELARRRAPAGGGLYARYLAAAVVRALDALYVQRNIRADVYVIPVPVAAGGPSDRATPRSRPVHGNYLAAPAVVLPREIVADWTLLGESIIAQLDGYVKSRTDLADWSVLWMGSQLRAWQFERALALPLGLPVFSTGFSYYREIDPPTRTFLGCPVTNLWGAAPMAIPPALNTAFRRFGDTLNFSLAWSEPHIDEATARTFAAGIRRQALDES